MFTINKFKIIFVIIVSFFLAFSVSVTNGLSSQQYEKKETAITLSQQAEEELERENYLEAIAIFKKAIKLNKNYVPARVGLAKSYYFLENYERAYIEIEEAKQIDRNSIIVFIWSAKINIKLEEFSTAKNELDVASNIDARNFELLMTYAEYYKEIGRYTEAIRYFDLASGTDESSVKPLIAKGDTYMLLNRTVEAYKSYKAALERNPRDAEANYSLANFFYITNNINEALEYVENAVIIEPYTNKYLELNYKLLFEIGKFDEAEILLKQLINFSNSQAEYYNDLGIALSKQGKYDESVMYMKQGIENFFGDEVLRWKAEMISLEGLPMRDEQRTGLSDYRYEMGVFYRDKNIINKAMFMLDRAIQLYPENMNYRYQKAKIYKELGLSDKYFQILNFIKREDPNFRGIDNDLEYYQIRLEDTLSGKLKIKQYELEKPRPKIVVSGIEIEKNSDSHYDANSVMQNILYRALATNETFSVGILESTKVRNETDELHEMKADLVIRGSMKESGNLLTVSIEVQNVYNGITLFQYEASQRGNDRFLNIALGFADNIARDIPIIGQIVDKKDNIVIVNLGTSQNIKIRDSLYIIGQESDLRVFLRSENNFNIEKVKDVSKAEITVEKIDEKLIQGKITSGDYIYTVNVNNFVLFRANNK